MDTSFNMQPFKSRILSWIKYRPTVKQASMVVGSALGLLVVANLVMLWYFQDHYYPNVKVGDINVGGMTQARARQVLIDVIDRRPLILNMGNKEVKISTAEFGAEYDMQATLRALDSLPRPMIPITSLIQAPQKQVVPLSLKHDNTKLNAKTEELIKEFEVQAVNARLEITDGNAKIIPDSLGRKYEVASVKASLLAALRRLSDEPTTISHKKITADVTSQDLQPALDQANQKLSTQIKLSFDGKNYNPTRTEIGTWLKLDDALRVVVDESSVAKYIEQISEEIDISVKNEVVTTLDGVETGRQVGQAGRSLNRTDTIAAIIKALQKPEDIDYQLNADSVEPVVEYVRKFSFSGLTYSYCVLANSVSQDMLGHFSQKIISTLADGRGWGMNGLIKFNQVSAGCSFNLVLAAASTLPNYSSACSIYWSCRVGPNVIINIDRWTGASDSWNQAGGSLDEYQSMVINHEVGHWLGFDHWTCGGSGQSAPVMLQQSISLQGCTFNAWPSSAELNSLRHMKGI